MRLDFRSESPIKRETGVLAVLRFEKPFEREVFRFNPFSSFRETTFVRVYWNAILESRHGMAPQVNESCKEMRRLSVSPINVIKTLITFMLKSYYIYGCSVHYIYGQILLHLWFVDLLHLWLKVITFMVSITFMVNFYYIYGWYYIYGFYYIYG